MRGDITVTPEINFESVCRCIFLHQNAFYDLKSHNAPQRCGTSGGREYLIQELLLK
jgi:hypothetical protein